MNYTPALEYLRGEQRPDGSFPAWSGTSGKGYVPVRLQPTPFQTSLILDCLQHIAGARDVAARASDYVASQTNLNGLWNYWEQHSQLRVREPYPDDFDDTACAIAALHANDKHIVTARQYGSFARSLTAVETAVGGPYGTWFVDTATNGTWLNIDPAVNANIGYTLAQQNACPAGLRKYIEATICDDSYRSSFYVGDIPTIFFISRWYTGSEQDQLRSTIRKQLAIADDENYLMQSLLLMSAHYQHVESPVLGKIQQRLASRLQQGSLPAEALYIDPVYNGQQHYGGSQVLTTAFALAAVSMSKEVAKTITRKAVSLAAITGDVAAIPSAALRQEYKQYVRRLTDGSAGSQVTAAASLITEHTGWRTAHAVRVRLNAASIHGWAAYSLYDDIIDDESDSVQVCMANIALRNSVRSFKRATPAESYHDYVDAIFNRMDAANDWELRNTRAKIIDGSLCISKLPDYKDYRQLSERSLGHGLVAIGLAVTQFGTMDHPAVVYLKLFYRHFLIARQLNDDAHDWQADLSRGQLSAVVCMLLADKTGQPLHVDIPGDMTELERLFWNRTIDTVAATIRKHTERARQALAGLEQYAKTDLFNSWLTTFDSSADAAIRERDAAKEFITGYEQVSR